MGNESARQEIDTVEVPIDSLQREAKALGDPTRYRLFRYVADAQHPVFVGELAALLGVNHNAVRQHLAVLKEVNLIVEQLEKRSQPGRPRLSYQLNPDFSGSWGTQSPYQTIAILLADVIKTRRSAREVGRAEGIRRARQPSGSRCLLEILHEDLRMGGFRPRSIPREGGYDLVLDTCPYLAVATLDSRTVCQLHLGLVEGLAAQTDQSATVGLVVRDPHQAGCCVKVRKAPDRSNRHA